MFNKNKKQRGFTLVELMIVITVIAILATIGVVSFSRVQKQARDTKRKADMRALATALQAWFTEKQAYPTAAHSPAVPVSDYIPVLPVAPQTKVAYTYKNDATLNTYALCGTLETTASASGTTWKVSTKNAGGYETNEAAATCAAE